VKEQSAGEQEGERRRWYVCLEGWDTYNGGQVLCSRISALRAIRRLPDWLRVAASLGVLKAGRSLSGRVSC
jgi:hypothetical protein